VPTKTTITPPGGLLVLYEIGEKCIKCYACVWNRVCPEGAIIERNGTFLIDRDICTDCGNCYAQEEYFCPVRAIVMIQPG
jgi:ferredoxin